MHLIPKYFCCLQLCYRVLVVVVVVFGEELIIYIQILTSLNLSEIISSSHHIHACNCWLMNQISYIDYRSSSLGLLGCGAVQCDVVGYQRFRRLCKMNPSVSEIISLINSVYKIYSQIIHSRLRKTAETILLGVQSDSERDRHMQIFYH